jgi:phosphatidylethanolamine-binding protein (PEBP) family uncharacterized protein
MARALRTLAFEQGGTIPKKYTCDGDDFSPALRWSGVPEGTRSLVLLCNDADAPGGHATVRAGHRQAPYRAARGWLIARRRP